MLSKLAKYYIIHLLVKLHLGNTVSTAPLWGGVIYIHGIAVDWVDLGGDVNVVVESRVALTLDGVVGVVVVIELTDVGVAVDVGVVLCDVVLVLVVVVIVLVGVLGEEVDNGVVCVLWGVLDIVEVVIVLVGVEVEVELVFSTISSMGEYHRKSFF